MKEHEARQVLGVGAADPPERIRAAYRELLKQWHPDRFSEDPVRGDEAARRTHQIVTAYRSLIRAGASAPAVAEAAEPEPFEEPLLNQWNPLHPSHDRYGPNNVWDRLAIAAVIIVGVALLIVFVL